MTRGIRLQEFLPATFRDRGVAVPCTTPALISARIRPAERDRAEFILANPGGGQGYYVMGWGAVRAMCRITMHDQLLVAALLELPELTPGTVRLAARALAIQGAAGHAAGNAAAEAQARDGEHALVANFILQLRLLTRAGVGELDGLRRTPPDEAMRSRVRESLAALEPALGADRHAILAWTGQLAAVIAPVGFPGKEYESRSQATLSGLVRLQASLTEFAGSDPSDSGWSARLIAEAAGLTVERGQQLLALCHAELDHPLALLRLWAARPGRVQELFGRPDWLLDGWPTICAIWESAGSERTTRREAVGEMERLVPAMPRLINQWLGGPAAVGDTPRRPWMPAAVDWRSGVHVLDRIARNEWLRAATP